MDEITEIQQGEETSVVDDETTSGEEVPTFTREQVDAEKAKARSDALTEVGRLRKAAEDNARIAKSVTERLQKREEEDMRREEEAAEGDPIKLSSIQLRRQAIKAQADADERIRRAEEKEAELQTQSREILTFNADVLAGKYNVSSDTLLKFGGETKGSMEELAKSYGERNTVVSNRMKGAPDSGKTKGSGKGLTVDDIKNMSPQERFDRRDEIANLPLGFG